MEYCDSFVYEKHIEYVLEVASDTESLAAIATENLRMSGVYWGLCTLECLNASDRMNKEDVVEWVMRCYNSDGGFGGNVDHDSNLVYTLSALQLLCMCDKLERVDASAVSTFIKTLYNPEGFFYTDKYGEIDLRFVYCAVQSMALLKRLDELDLDQIAKYICRCQNIDGGFGSVPGSESHAGMVFCAMGSLSIIHHVHDCHIDRLCKWLEYRQVDSGGFNGRPEKQCDLCYGWWTLSSMIILNYKPFRRDALVDFMLKCQDPRGGLSDRPNDERDLYHTFFGIAGLNMLGYLDDIGIPNTHINPTYALPESVVNKLHLPYEMLRYDSSV